MSRPCTICTRPDRQAIDALIGSGVSDYEVGRQFGIERTSVGRHRRQHIIRPAQHRLAVVAKDRDAKRERKELAAAAASDAPSTAELVEATIGLRKQVEELSDVGAQLKRMAQKAEDAGLVVGVTQVAAQRLRSVEVGSRLAGIGGFAPGRAADQTAQREPFQVNIIFSDAPEKNTTISMLPVEQEIDADREQDDQPDEA